MDERTLRVLEYDKIRRRLAGETSFPPGRERAEALTPTTDLSLAQQWQEETEEAVRLINQGSGIPLGGVRDLRPFLSRAMAGAHLTPEELLNAAQTLRGTRRLKASLAEKGDLAPHLAAMADNLVVPGGLEEEIWRCLDEEGGVKDEASAELGRLRREKRTLFGRLRDKLDSLLRSPEIRGYLQEALVTQRGDRYVLPVKQECKNMVPGLVHDQSASGATLFIEPMPVVELNNSLRQAELKERDEIRRILARLSGLVGKQGLVLERDMEILGSIDLISARGRLALEMRAVRPDLREGGWIELHQARHPLLAGEVVPVDVELGRGFRTLVITGPNTGGKTVTLKTIGLLALMAQAGLFVPAEGHSRLTVFRQVFADIGDEQSIEQSLSTFSSHMTNLVRIVGAAGPGTLALLDELGAGTDPTEGAALAMAILEFLHGQGVWTVATTHYSELKTFAYSRPGVKNASVEFDSVTLRPTYRLILGLPGRSNAFEISQRLGLREEIIQRARGHLSQDEIKVEELIGQIERDRMAAERDRLEMARGKEEAARIKADYQQRWKELRDKEKGILEKARWESREALRRTKAELGEIIETLRREGREAGEKERERAIARARGALAHIGEEIEVASVSGEEAAHQRPPLTVLKPGQRVYVTGLNLEATVLAAAEGDEVLVQAGLLKVKVKLADLRGVEEPVTREKGPAGVRAGGLGRPPGGADKGRRAFRVSTSEDPRTVSQDRGGTGIGNEERDNYGQLSAGKATDISSELDLRGLMADEAIERTDKFLDDAFLAGAPKVRIIHGKGTGALRRAIGEFLRHHPHVLSQRLGLFGEGGDGVTIVELR